MGWRRVLVGWLVCASVAASGQSQDPPSAGLALRRALELQAAGRPAEAAVAFAEVAAAHPIIADHASRLRVEALLAAGEPAAAAAAARAFAEGWPGSPLGARVLRLEGDAAAAAGDPAAAQTAWRAALAETRDRATRAQLRLALAASLEGSGAREEAIALYQHLFTLDAGYPEGDPAARALERLEAETGAALRAPGDWVKRGDALYDARDNPGALAAYDRAIARGVQGAPRERARSQRAHTLFRLRRYPEAREAFAALGGGAEARYWRARSTARGGDPKTAIVGFEALASGSSRFGPQARLLAATLLDDDDETRPRAIDHYTWLASQKGVDRALRETARWRLGWLRYQEGRWSEARDHFRHLAGLSPDAVGALRGRYWALRAAEQDGGGSEGFAELAAAFPFTYYGWLAAQRVPEVPARPKPAAPAPAPVRLDATALERVRILIEARLDEEAADEVAGLEPRIRSDSDRLELAALYGEAGRHDRGQRLILGRHLEELARGPAPGREGLWGLAWPRPFDTQVAAATPGASGLEANLVYAVMREESGFRPAVVSPVGARGLLQIMPETGQRLAADLGTPFDAEALFDPATNVRFGSHYLDGLLARFGGRRAAAVASYNAGPQAVERWIAAGPGLAEDEWIEAIPYDETRGYVRRVLRSLHVYRTLYP